MSKENTVSHIKGIAKRDFDGINTHSLPVTWEGDRWPFIDLKHVIIYLDKRPFYCDRGRFQFWVESKDQTKLSLDWADGFPRYFFSLQRAFDEINDWVQFRKLKPI